MHDRIFALDIGTRSVVGILLQKKQEGYEFLDMEIMEHQERAMLNGQIHNAPLVSKVVGQVKKILEERNHLGLYATSVAAAGRSLVTRKEKTEEVFPEERIISREDITRLKLSCVHKAQFELKSREDGGQYHNYYCVGYSVTRSFLDDIELGNLEGQKGRKIAVEIVAAFLPKIVLESLKFVVEDNGLELRNLTLEPIAAINAIIPSTMRRLNLALVDIGAGTSDIAISSEGAIHAYGMVPMAGDEVTEKISSDFLLDFNEAEKVKRKISLGKPVKYKDVLGMQNEASPSQLLDSIAPVVDSLAEEIALNIRQLNGRSPQAVILIGGGSLTPGIEEGIAEKLEIPRSRVAVQSTKSIAQVHNLPKKFMGPEFITPIGIALTEGNDSHLGFIQVGVNQQTVSVLNLGYNSVFDALLSAGIDAARMSWRPGLSRTIRVNGKIRMIPGTPGKPSEILVNGNPARLEDPIHAGDQITSIPGEDGQEAQVWLSDFVPPRTAVYLQGQEVQVPLEVVVDGAYVTDYHQELRDNANVTIRELHTLGEFLHSQAPWALENVEYNLLMGNQAEAHSRYRFQWWVNGESASLDRTLSHSDRVDVHPGEGNSLRLSTILQERMGVQERRTMQIFMDDTPLEVTLLDYRLLRNGETVQPEEEVRDGDTIELSVKEIKNPVLIDVFKEINFKPQAPEGMSRVEIMLNGEEAEYMSPIKEGDRIRINWR